MRIFKFKTKTTHKVRAVFLHGCITYSCDAFLFPYGSSEPQAWVGFTVLIQTIPFVPGSPSHPHISTTVHPEHTGGDNLFFSTATSAATCYGFSFICSSVLFSPCSCDSRQIHFRSCPSVNTPEFKGNHVSRILRSLVNSDR